MNMPRFKKEWLLYGLAGMGISFASVTIAQSQPELERTAPRGPMNISPYQQTIAATAVVEPASEAIRIVPEIDGRIVEVSVQAGDFVRQGDVLYRLDATLLQAAQREAEAAIASAQAQVSLREAEIITAQTSLDAAKLEAVRAIKTVNRYEPLLPDGISPDAFDQLVNDADNAMLGVRKAENALRTASLNKQAAIENTLVTKAARDAAAAKRAQATMRSPIDGQVLSVDLRPGDVIRFSQGADHSITVGSITTLHLRTEIDEAEAARFRQNQPAVAYLRGAEATPLPVQFLSYDPILKKKSNFLSVSSERLDSRVLEVTYVLKQPRDVPLYVGQLVDVYINADTGPTKLAQPATTAPVAATSTLNESKVAGQQASTVQSTTYQPPQKTGRALRD